MRLFHIDNQSIADFTACTIPLLKQGIILLVEMFI